MNQRKLRSARLLGFDPDGDDFPVGVFSADTAGKLETIKECHITLGHRYVSSTAGTPANWSNELDDILKLSAKHNCTVFATLPGIECATNRSGFNLSVLKRIADTAYPQPSLAFWYLADEPTYEGELPISVDQLQKAYKVLHRYPKAPVLIACKNARTAITYGDLCCDLLLLDPYNLKSQSFPDVPLATLSKMLVKVKRELHTPVAPVIQITSLDPRNTAYRRPHAEELRYWCFSSLAIGVRGLFFWSLGRENDLTHFSRVLKPAVEDVMTFIDLAAPAHVLTRNATNQPTAYSAIFRRHGRDYVIVANGSSTKREVEVYLPGPYPSPPFAPLVSTRNARVRVIQSRDIHLPPTRLCVSAHPWEVFVWERKF